MSPLQNLKTQAQELLRTGRHEEAGQLLRRICAVSDADGESWFLLGALLGTQGDAMGAADCFRKVLAISPDFHQARFNLGIALRDQGLLDDARDELEAVVASHEGHVEACNALGYVYVRLERPDDAERCFRAALARNPSFPDALINLGNLLTAQQRWAEGIALYRRALQAAPGHADAAVNLGNALVMQGRMEEGIAAYRLAIVNNGAFVEAHIQLGNALKQTGRLQEAAGAFQGALRISPNHEEARFFLACLGGDVRPSTAPSGYVARLFDEYSESFDTELVGRLQYVVPERMLQAVKSELKGKKNLNVLDLGCGTGLCGSLFRPLARRLSGVDISPKMVAKAHARGAYDQLDVAEINTVLRSQISETLDLVIAADVFIYIGDLAPVFETVKDALRSSGLFAFSLETPAASEQDEYVLRSSGRFAHPQGYISRLQERFGFQTVMSEEIDIRQEAGQPVLGALHVLRRL